MPWRHLQTVFSRRSAWTRYLQKSSVFLQELRRKFRQGGNAAYLVRISRPAVCFQYARKPGMSRTVSAAERQPKNFLPQRAQRNQCAKHGNQETNHKVTRSSIAATQTPNLPRRHRDTEKSRISFTAETRRRGENLRRSGRAEKNKVNRATANIA